MANLSPEHQPNSLPEKDASTVQLASDLWIDLDAGIVLRTQQKIPLTARETHVLRILVQSLRNGRKYMSSQSIAERLHLSDLSDPEHAVEQTISAIRQKLGETAYHPCILQGRRGFGYRLFPEVKQNSNSQQ